MIGGGQNGLREGAIFVFSGRLPYYEVPSAIFNFHRIAKILVRHVEQDYGLFLLRESGQEPSLPTHYEV